MRDGRPLIGITSENRATSGVFSAPKPTTTVNDAYLHALLPHGCIPVMLSSLTAPGDVPHLAEWIDGLLLMSGADIDPICYGEKQRVVYSAEARGAGTPFHRPVSMAPSVERDRFEIDMYRACVERDLPVLGICRGMQLINTAEGGALHQEILEAGEGMLDHFVGDDGWIHYHDLRIERGTRTHETLGVESYFTSSVHHQAVRCFGQGLVAAARSSDGIIEVIESTQHPWVIGVQGHCEQTVHNLGRFNALFEAFVEAARMRTR